MERKVEQRIEKFLQSDEKKALLITGADVIIGLNQRNLANKRV